MRYFVLRKSSAGGNLDSQVTTRFGDLTNFASVLEATRRVDVVFHAGGKVSHSGSYLDFQHANVLGSQNIIDACKQNGVRILIYTSTPSVIADGTDHFGVDESHPYPDKFFSHYAQSKAQAEQLVLAANSLSLTTVVLRPHMIWGPGKSKWVQGILKLAKNGRLPQVGSGKNRVGMTYIDDCVDAHIAAWRAAEADPNIGGHAYFINSGGPVLLWDWVRELLVAYKLAPIRHTVSRNAMFAAAQICDAILALSTGTIKPPISRYLISELTTEHYSVIGRAREKLLFVPKVSVGEGLARMLASNHNAS